MTFTIPIEPSSLQFSGRRVMVRNGKPVFFKNKTASRYENTIGLLTNQHRPAVPFAGPIMMKANFIIKRPALLNGKKHADGRICATKRPDLDNYQKFLQDSLRGFWEDDSQIVDLHIRKFYAAKGEEPCIEIQIEQI